MAKQVVRLNEETLKDLVATYLYQLGVVRYSEDVEVISICRSEGNGLRTVIYKTKPKEELIFHDG